MELWFGALCLCLVGFPQTCHRNEPGVRRIVKLLLDRQALQAGLWPHQDDIGASVLLEQVAGVFLNRGPLMPGQVEKVLGRRWPPSFPFQKAGKKSPNNSQFLKNHLRRLLSPMTLS